MREIQVTLAGRTLKTRKLRLASPCCLRRTLPIVSPIPRWTMRWIYILFFFGGAVKRDTLSRLMKLPIRMACRVWRTMWPLNTHFVALWIVVIDLLRVSYICCCYTRTPKFDNEAINALIINVVFERLHFWSKS